MSSSCYGIWRKLRGAKEKFFLEDIRGASSIRGLEGLAVLSGAKLPLRQCTKLQIVFSDDAVLTRMASVQQSEHGESVVDQSINPSWTVEDTKDVPNQVTVMGPPDLLEARIHLHMHICMHQHAYIHMR